MMSTNISQLKYAFSLRSRYLVLVGKFKIHQLRLSQCPNFISGFLTFPRGIEWNIGIKWIKYVKKTWKWLYFFLFFFQVLDKVGKYNGTFTPCYKEKLRLRKTKQIFAWTIKRDINFPTSNLRNPWRNRNMNIWVRKRVHQRCSLISKF